jgi:hypothetical protein
MARPSTGFSANGDKVNKVTGVKDIPAPPDPLTTNGTLSMVRANQLHMA